MSLTQTQLVALKTEITTDPLALGYADKSDADVAALLNDRTRGRTRVVSPTMVNARTIMARLGAAAGATILDKLDAAKAGSPPIKWVFQFITQGEGIDVGHAETRAMLDQLVAATVLTSAERDGVKSLAVFPCSRAEELFGAAVDHIDVANARA